MSTELSRWLNEIPGFLAPEEAMLLYRLARDTHTPGRVVELGSYQGLSTAFLAGGTRDRADGSLSVIAIDHHTGSSEHQPGQVYFDPAVVNAAGDGIDTYARFRENIRAAGLERWVELWRCTTLAAAERFSGEIRLLFVDASHELELVAADVRAWAPYLAPDGLLCMHDVGDWEGPTIVAASLVESGYEEFARAGSLLALQVPSSGLRA
ncbi:MAG: class I SAM-dependent methyltransferase [Phycisphaerales bacterium]|nr:class I SAM-dependent methyltransferase [Phycisphaerales bacterium]